MFKYKAVTPTYELASARHGDGVEVWSLGIWSLGILLIFLFFFFFKKKMWP